MKYQDLFPIPIEWVQDVDESMADTVSSWAEQEVKSKRLEHKEDYDSLLRPAMGKLFKDIGLQTMLLPEELGGGGMGTPEAATTAAVILEQVGAADSGIGFLYANTLALQYALAVSPNRNDELLKEVAPLFSGDEITLCSLVLPAYGSDTGDRARYYGLDYPAAASKKGEGWVVSGGPARPQCCGATASVFGVVCDLGDGTPGVVLVPGGANGVKKGETFLKTGLAASVNADITFKDVQVTASALVSQGVEAVRDMLSWYYMACAAVCDGAMQTTYEILQEWGDTRVIKGKGQVFKENPLVASLMGEIGGKISSSRVLTYNLARMLSRPDIYGSAGNGSIHVVAISTFKQVSRQAMQAIDNTMELMASAGYATEWNLERYWRDVKTVETYVIPETVAQTCMARQYFNLKKL
ncbi:MAG TPA: acyl-CoA dehydrogenase family protein [Candidatus Anoxymicrobiaceae bacterium]